MRYRNVVVDSLRWQGFEFRGGDIVIATPPKCGTTWMQMICALLIFGGPELPARLTELSPWMDILTEPQEAVWSALASQTHRRFIKSHTPLDGIPWDERVTYITVGRDPRDVAVSWANHFDNMDLSRLMAARVAAVGLEGLEGAPAPPPSGADPVAEFWQWVEDDAPPEAVVSGLRATLHHLDTFWRARNESNVALFHYTDLMEDLDGEMRRLASILDINVPEHRWPQLVKAARFAAMRERADQLAPQVRIDGFWKEASRFFNRGGTGQWQELVDPWDEARYRRRVATLVPGELDRWVHGGWRALASAAPPAGR
ncbi:MAG TPA: sulfotransferase domain-containing protein [Acidimicrobiales bacterium]|nr:sulfotransferase domain-containing protein [Acidimicrobiales bacterium]